jgi:hypothetical protein
MFYTIKVRPQATSDSVRSYKMTVTFIEVETLEGVVEHAIIDRGNGEFTSMPKSVYDEQQAAIKP